MQSRKTTMATNRAAATFWVTRLGRLVTLCALLGAYAHVAQARNYAQRYIGFALKSCDKTEAQMPEYTRVGEIVANRYIAGGMIGFTYNGQGLADELIGRAGGIMHVSFDRPWKKEERTDAEKANDVCIVNWVRTPTADEMPALQALRKRGCYIIAFGPRDMPALAKYHDVADVWFDTGLGDDDRVVRLPDGSRAGQANLLVEMLQSWTLTAEIVGALTRHGKMPTMWKSFSYADGRDWMDKYYGKKQFHDDLQVPPNPPGKLGHDFLQAIRTNLKEFDRTQMPSVEKAADLIIDEYRQGRKTVVATSGHTPFTYMDKGEEKIWSVTMDLNDSVPAQVEDYNKTFPDGALVLRLGYSGMHTDEADIFRKKHQRVILIAAPNPRPEWAIPNDMLDYINMGWAFGDAAVTIPGYPLKAFAPSGIMQMVAFESVNLEVLARLPKVATPPVAAGAPQ